LLIFFRRVTFCCVCPLSDQSFLLHISGNLFLFLFKRFSLLKTSGQVSYRFSTGKCVTFGKKAIRTQKMRNMSQFDAQMGPGVSEAKKIKKLTFLKKQLCLGKTGPQNLKTHPLPPPRSPLAFVFGFFNNYVEHL